MYSPGVCGAILATLPQHANERRAGDPGSQLGAAGTPAQSKAQDVGPLIDALNADTEMVLVAAAETADALAPAVWTRAAYLVRLPPGATEADGLRALLQETLSRGRDAVLVTTLAGPPLTAVSVGLMVAAYRAAGHEIWAVVPETPESQLAYPMLLGRRMIELFLRGREWRSVQDVLSANREHVHALNLSDGVRNEPSAGSLG